MSEENDNNVPPQSCREAYIRQRIGEVQALNDTCARIRIGPYLVCRRDENTLWIENDKGEGVRISAYEAERVIEMFMNKILAKRQKPKE